MTPFQPSGDRARWRVIYDMLARCDVGSVITYEEMASELDLDPINDRHAIQMAMRRASKEFEEERKHAVKPLPNVGYRVAAEPEHLDLAKAQQKLASKALVRGKSKVVNVDLNKLEPDVRSAFQVVARAFSMQMEMSRRLDARQDNLEQVVRDITDRQARSDDEVSALTARLAAIEGKVAQSSSRTNLEGGEDGDGEPDGR